MQPRRRQPERRPAIPPVRPVIHRPTTAARQLAATSPSRAPMADIVVSAKKPVNSVPPKKTAPLVPELSTDRKVSAMITALEKARRELEKERQKRAKLKKVSLFGLSIIIILVTGYVAYDAWTTTQRIKTETSLTSESSNIVQPTITTEGADRSPLPESALANYKVAADAPRALYVNRLGIAARVLPMGVNTDGSIQAPVNIYDAGWYTGSEKPGQKGAMFIDGHSSGATRQGLFGSLNTLVVGDELQLEKGDGTRLTYRVVHTETIPLENVDMRKALEPYGNTTRGLNLMTCAGQWDEASDTLDQRTIVYTEQV